MGHRRNFGNPRVIQGSFPGSSLARGVVTDPIVVQPNLSAPGVVQRRKGVGLHKRWTLPAAAITHIFDGNIAGNSFSGFHSEQRKNPGNGLMQIVNIDAANTLARNSGTRKYVARVRVSIGGAMRGPVLGVQKSFFPTSWAEADIIRWIEQALTAPRDSTRSTRAGWTATPRQIRTTATGGQLTSIRVNGIACTVQYNAGVVESVHPA